MMSNACRTFAGGVTTDNVVTSAVVAASLQLSVAFWLNITSVDSTGRRPYSFSNPDYVIWDSTAGDLFSFLANFSTTGGQWRIAAPTTGVWNQFVITYDSSNVANTPIIYQNGVSQSVTTVTTPVGTAFQTNAVLVVGNRPSNTTAINGSMFAFARWNVLLTANDAALLGTGTPPCSSLLSAKPILYLPLDRGESPEPDLAAANNGTVTGTTVGTGPPNLKARCRLFVPTHPLIGTAVGGPFFAHPLG